MNGKALESHVVTKTIPEKKIQQNREEIIRLYHHSPLDRGNSSKKKFSVKSFEDNYRHMLEYQENVKRKVENELLMKELLHQAETAQLNFDRMFSKSTNCSTQVPFLKRQMMFASRRQKRIEELLMEQRSKNKGLLECSFHPVINKSMIQS